MTRAELIKKAEEEVKDAVDYKKMMCLTGDLSPQVQLIQQLLEVIKDDEWIPVVSAIEQRKAEIHNQNGMMAFGMDEAIKVINTFFEPKVDAVICPNCESEMPEGCSGHFLNDGKDCLLNANQPTGADNDA